MLSLKVVILCFSFKKRFKSAGDMCVYFEIYLYIEILVFCLFYRNLLLGAPWCTNEELPCGKWTSWIRHFFTPGLNSNLLPLELIKKYRVKPNFTVVRI